MESPDKKKKSTHCLAEESPQTKRARDKLLKQWKAQEQLVTQQALEEALGKIHKWIAANASYRVSLKNKDIRLFDHNQNAALLSRRVQQFAEKLRADFEASPEEKVG